MTPAQKQLITATVPVLRENGVALTTHFYKRMFSHHAELRNLFNMGNQKNGKQQTALAMAVLAYAEHIADPSVLMPVVDRIAHKHTSLDIRPEYYPVVGKHLIASIKEVLGDAATPEILDAWGAAYDQLAKLMIGHEANLYTQQIAKPNGWTGWRPFRVGRKIQESEEITSFYLYPTDGGKVTPHLPGQYISLRLFLPELHLNQARQYSLSGAPSNSHYRISVKREKGTDLDSNGLISNHLHDFITEESIIEITPPTGNFLLPADLKAPVMFISGGVGLTPLLSMLEYLSEKAYTYPVTWIHGCRNRSVHAFKEQLNHIASAQPNMVQHIFYNTLTEKDKQAGIIEGNLDINKLPLKHHPDTLYFICGPGGFIQKQYRDLIAKNVNKDNIFFEEFGPQVLQLN